MPRDLRRKNPFKRGQKVSLARYCRVLGYNASQKIKMSTTGKGRETIKVSDLFKVDETVKTDKDNNRAVEAITIPWILKDAIVYMHRLVTEKDFTVVSVVEKK